MPKQCSRTSAICIIKFERKHKIKKKQKNIIFWLQLLIFYLKRTLYFKQIRTYEYIYSINAKNICTEYVQYLKNESNLISYTGRKNLFLTLEEEVCTVYCIQRNKTLAISSLNVFS